MPLWVYKYFLAKRCKKSRGEISAVDNYLGAWTIVCEKYFPESAKRMLDLVNVQRHTRYE
jgi:hypothetical protein